MDRHCPLPFQEVKNRPGLYSVFGRKRWVPIPWSTLGYLSPTFQSPNPPYLSFPASGLTLMALALLRSPRAHWWLPGSSRALLLTLSQGDSYTPSKPRSQALSPAALSPSEFIQPQADPLVKQSWPLPCLFCPQGRAAVSPGLKSSLARGCVLAHLLGPSVVPGRQRGLGNQKPQPLLPTRPQAPHSPLPTLPTVWGLGVGGREGFRQVHRRGGPQVPSRALCSVPGPSSKGGSTVTPILQMRPPRLAKGTCLPEVTQGQPMPQLCL